MHIYWYPSEWKCRQIKNKQVYTQNQKWTVSLEATKMHTNSAFQGKTFIFKCLIKLLNIHNCPTFPMKEIRQLVINKVILLTFIYCEAIVQRPHVNPFLKGNGE